MKLHMGEDILPVPQAALAHHPHWLMQLMNALMVPPSFFQPHRAASFHMVTRPDMQTELMIHREIKYTQSENDLLASKLQNDSV